jgi:hypothetical protein
MIEVIQAHKDGKAIQFKKIIGGIGYFQSVDFPPCWNFNAVKYRPKPEPKEYWLVPYKYYDGYKVFSYPLAKLGKTDISNLDLPGTIHVKEVIEELNND